MVVVMVVVLGTLLLLLRPRSAMNHAPGIQCMNNLHLIGVGFRDWAGDHNGMTPMRFYTNQAGDLRFADATNGFRCFKVMSNELRTPGLLHCPADRDRSRATNFSVGFGNPNVSYFLALDTVAWDASPTTFLAGDDNITGGASVKNGVLLLSVNTPSGWTVKRHEGKGNVLLNDGSVQNLTSSTLNRAVARSGTNVIRLLMPRVFPPGTQKLRAASMRHAAGERALLYFNRMAPPASAAWTKPTAGVNMGGVK